MCESALTRTGKGMMNVMNLESCCRDLREVLFFFFFFFFAALFCVYGDYKTQSKKPNNKQKTSPQRYKTQIKILLFPGLA